MKKAFTIIELLVVIGIIGVLSGILMTSFSGGTSSARAAKCLTNMRNLAQAAISCASNGKTEGYDESRRFPLAGSRAELANNDDIEYYENVGWISWLSKNDEYATHNANRDRPKSFVSVKNASAYSKGTDNGDAVFAITNGALWGVMNGNREVYVCPDHQRAAAKKGVNANWSYVMNAYFGYDWSDGSRAVGIIGTSEDRVTLNSARLDRTLLFAELPFNDHEYGGGKVEANFSTSADPENDCVLQYKAGSIDGDNYDNSWNGKAESIAFNHQSGKRWCAHVVFADGHTEKLLLPKTSGGLSKEQLTALLCGGVDKDGHRIGGQDVSFHGGTYQKLKN